MSGVSTGDLPVIVLFPSGSDCERIIISDAHLRNKEEDMNECLFGSVENIFFSYVLGGFAPATVASPFAISVKNRFSIIPSDRC